MKTNVMVFASIFVISHFIALKILNTTDKLCVLISEPPQSYGFRGCCLGHLQWCFLIFNR